MFARPFVKSSNSITRRHVLTSLVATVGFYRPAAAIEFPFGSVTEQFRFSEPQPDVIAQVVPSAEIPTGFVFGDSIQKLIAAGVLDPDKFHASQKDLPDWVARVLTSPSDDPIIFSEQTASILVNLLWPLGLANRAAFNQQSPVYTPGIPAFASTGGWTHAIEMADQAQSLVLEVATNTFRPCCDNSTLYQDCNHGSALLGLLELAASQGAMVEGLYGVALTANSFWFPDNYAKTALYFSHFHRRSWSEIAPKLVLGSDFSSLSGWEKNVDDPLQQANLRLPGEARGQQAC